VALVITAAWEGDGRGLGLGGGIAVPFSRNINGNLLLRKVIYYYYLTTDNGQRVRVRRLAQGEIEPAPATASREFQKID